MVLKLKDKFTPEFELPSKRNEGFWGKRFRIFLYIENFNRDQLCWRSKLQLQCSFKEAEVPNQCLESEHAKIKSNALYKKR